MSESRAHGMGLQFEMHRALAQEEMPGDPLGDSEGWARGRAPQFDDGGLHSMHQLLQRQEHRHDHRKCHRDRHAD